ncbi:hypothetical protein ACRE_079600 [Hapsidospora chrysogenum ATCC 11550]|uniref:Uncharacterized protein n=1 Tax=Hapsidospora chrysogenum (strain ATCC 11550 / CBS 779.69 / DSM 880 / IAM 14645 / JCM 23072 / IMI 49137) TaxID=857340 RepID=A0A086SW47_HAPC1|nr:hypothetical protein ACRE_079600 [Hapsidospora chrysogenum ATCC 11550]
MLIIFTIVKSPGEDLELSDALYHSGSAMTPLLPGLEEEPARGYGSGVASALHLSKLPDSNAVNTVSGHQRVQL